MRQTQGIGGGWRRRGAWATGVAVLLTACAAGDGRDVGVSGDRNAATATAYEPGSVSPPPGVDPQRVEAMPARDRRKLSTSVDELKRKRGIEAPAFVDREPPAEDPLMADSEPSLVAQRAYARARAALKERRGFDALRELRTAIRAAPNDAAVVKLMAQVQAAGGNTAQAAVLLEKAVTLEPGDATAWLELGRLALGRGDLDEAVWLLSRGRAALEGEGAGDETAGALLEYHLAVATTQMGEAKLALGFYESFMEMDARPVAGSGAGRMLAMLESAAWQTYSAMGDLHLRLDQPGEAVRLYEAAIAEVADDDPVDAALLGRLVYAQLRAGDAAAARSVASGALADGRWREALALAAYLRDQGVGVEGLVGLLRERYEDGDRPTALALGMTRLLGRDEAMALLRDRLATGADAGNAEASAAVVDRLLGLLVSGGEGGEGGEGGARSALGVVGEVLPGDAAGQRAVVSRLIERVGSGEVIEAAESGWPESTGAVALAEGVARAISGDGAGAREALRRAMGDEATATVARVELAKLLLMERRWQAAWEAVEPVSVEADEQAGRLRVRLLRHLGRTDEALALLNEMLADGTGDVALFLERAELEAGAGDWAAAERTLLEALNLDAESEVAYAALFELYEAAGAELEDTTGRYQRLMRRMLGEIPDARIARLKRAEWADARREFGEAERLLRGLLEENANDLEALDLLMDVLRRADRPAEATALIEARLEESPESVALLRLAQQHYGATGQREQFLAATERLLERMPTSAERAEGLASVYLSRGRLEDAERVIREALELRGEEAMDDPGLALTLALVLQRRGDVDGAVELKRDILEAHPDHAMTANDLAYHFAVRGESLDEALRLAKVATDADPGSSAYVDTLGWVYYKLGRFDEAAAELGRSLALARQEERRGQGDRSETRAVVSDHLGDAMYRLGRAEQAQRYWEMARRLAPDGPGVFDPDLEGLKDRLSAKLSALAAGEAAPVAEVSGVPIEAIEPAERAGDDQAE